MDAFDKLGLNKSDEEIEKDIHAAYERFNMKWHNKAVGRISRF
jgi:hypothetical protein